MEKAGKMEGSCRRDRKGWVWDSKWIGGGWGRVGGGVDGMDKPGVENVLKRSRKRNMNVYTCLALAYGSVGVCGGVCGRVCLCVV